MLGAWRSVLRTAVITVAVVLPAAGAPNAPATDEPSGACQVSDTGRFADCASGFYSWSIRQSNGGEVIGTVDVAFTISEVVSPTSREWSAHWTVFVINLTGVAESGTTMAVVPECGSSCTAGSGLPDNGAVLSRNQTVTGDVPFASPGTGRDTSTQTVNIYLFNPGALSPGTTYGDPRTTLGPVRCDDGVPGEEGEPATPGCVVNDEVPTFVINSSEFKSPAAPVHAAFVGSAPADPRTMGNGRPGSGLPLEREIQPTREAKKAKRDLVCGPDFPRYPSPPGTPAWKLDTCDEYPYSSTRQGVPRFAVIGHVPQRDNNDAGGQLNEFYQESHITDGDQFYVKP